MKWKILMLILGGILMLSLVSSEYGIGGGSSYGIGSTTSSISGSVNYTNVNVNNSQFLRGYTWETNPYFKWWYNFTETFFPYLNTASNNLQANITAVNTSLISYVDSKLITEYYNATTGSIIRGTVAGELSYTYTYDNNPYNVTEQAGSPGIDIIMNFTGIENFNQIIFRYKNTQGENHLMKLQLYDYDSSSWENYGTESAVPDWTIFEFGVFDDTDHIQDGVVQVRVLSEDNGNTQHIHYFDWVAIANGPATPAGQEVDPLFETWKSNDIDLGNIGFKVNGTGFCFNSTTGFTGFGTCSPIQNVHLSSQTVNNAFRASMYSDLTGGSRRNAFNFVRAGGTELNPTQINNTMIYGIYGNAYNGTGFQQVTTIESWIRDSSGKSSGYTTISTRNVTDSSVRTRMTINEDGNINITGDFKIHKLAGTGNDYACLDADGQLFRSDTAC